MYQWTTLTLKVASFNGQEFVNKIADRIQPTDDDGYYSELGYRHITATETDFVGDEVVLRVDGDRLDELKHHADYFVMLHDAVKYATVGRFNDTDDTGVIWVTDKMNPWDKYDAGTNGYYAEDLVAEIVEDWGIYPIRGSWTDRKPDYRKYNHEYDDEADDSRCEYCGCKQKNSVCQNPECATTGQDA